MKIQLKQAYSFYQLGSRSNQEDARYPDSDKPEMKAPFFVVCDGVGGSDKGEVASGTVCRSFARSLENFDFSKEFTEADFDRVLAQAYADLEVVATDENRDMATTLTFVAFHAKGCFIAHIGDSRVYYVRKDKGIVYRTEDHSLVNALVKNGCITEEEALTHPDRNVITRAMGVKQGDKDYAKATLHNVSNVQPGDYVFLCSDGVLKNVTDQSIIDILSSVASDEEKRAIFAEMSASSDDNNTAIFVQVDTVERGEEDKVAAPAVPNKTVMVEAVRTMPTATVANQEKRKKNNMPLIVTIVVAVVVALAAGAYFLLGSSDEESNPASSQREREGEDVSLIERITGEEDAGAAAGEAAREEADEEGNLLGNLLGGNGAESVSARPAQFPGGRDALNRFFAEKMKYPEEALKKRIEGEVKVRIEIDDDGIVKDAKAEGLAPKVLAEEAERLCMKLPRFIPATDNKGEKIDSEMDVVVRFKLPRTPQQPRPNQGHGMSELPVGTI